MINYCKHKITSEDKKKVNKVLSSDFLTQGPEVLKFENKLSKVFSAKYAKVVTNATCGLYLAVKSLNLKKGFNAIVTANSFVASANCVLMNGGNIEFCDINIDNFNICTESLEKKLKQKKIDLVVAVDIAGNPCDWLKLKKLSKTYNFKIINDNCHAIGTKYLNKINYAVKYADLVVHSYHSIKNITSGEGGSILTNNAKYYRKISKSCSHGIEKRGKKFPWHYEINEIGYNFRLTDFQCALGLSQLNDLNKKISRRRKIAKIYDDFFKKDSRFKIQKMRKKSISSYHLYIVLFPFKKLIQKKFFFEYFAKKGFKLQTHYIPIYKHNVYAKLKKTFNFPNCENYYIQSASLPLYEDLKLKDIKRIIDLINNYDFNK
jgi:dTDP-4-amino-4,6-dideoxygalactose transaminase